ncbi:MAG: hypothetical protein JJU22_13385 [Gammaproteobacteria bacterium]|nr:hypothetical protein [Gammaproteobacteria bacterium]
MQMRAVLLRILLGWIAGLAPWLAMSGSRLMTGNYDKFFRSPAEQMVIEWLFLLIVSAVAIAGAVAFEFFRSIRRGLRPMLPGRWTTAVIAFAALPVAFGTLYFLLILGLILELAMGRAIPVLIAISVLALLGADLQMLAWAVKSDGAGHS